VEEKTAVCFSLSLPTCLLADKLAYLFSIVGRFDYSIESGVSEDVGKIQLVRLRLKKKIHG